MSNLTFSFIFLFACKFALAFVKQGDFIVREEPFFIPGDIIQVKYKNLDKLYMRALDSPDFIKFDINLLKNFNNSLVQFAVKKERVNILSFDIKIKTNLEKFLKEQVICRNQWHALPAKDGMSLDKIKHKFAVHHSEGSAVSSAQTVQSIQRYHVQDNKWPDIGYHFLIGRDGMCFEGRQLAYQGSHVHKHNKANIGICFLGCFESSEGINSLCTTEMIKKIAELIGVLAAHYNIKLSHDTIKGHREYEGAHTLCPGDRVINHMETIISEASRIKKELLEILH